MAFYTTTTKDLDKIIDETDRIARSLNAGTDREERLLLEEALGNLRQVRNLFLAQDYDDERKRNKDG